jgi:hypothetical protein
VTHPAKWCNHSNPKFVKGQMLCDKPAGHKSKDGTVEEIPRANIFPAQPGYVNANLNGVIGTTRKRIAHLKARAEHVATRASYETADGATVADAAWEAYIEVSYPERPSRDIIDELKAAGFHWGQGRWVGERVKLPERYRSG